MTALPTDLHVRVYMCGLFPVHLCDMQALENHKDMLFMNIHLLFICEQLSMYVHGAVHVWVFVQNGLSQTTEHMYTHIFSNKCQLMMHNNTCSEGFYVQHVRCTCKLCCQNDYMYAFLLKKYMYSSNTRNTCMHVHSI